MEAPEDLVEVPEDLVALPEDLVAPADDLVALPDDPVEEPYEDFVPAPEVLRLVVLVVPLGDTVLMRVLEEPEVRTLLLTVVWGAAPDELAEDPPVLLPDLVDEPVPLPDALPVDEPALLPEPVVPL